MNRKIMPKVVLIIVLILLAGITIYPPSQKLKVGIDLGGGTALVYQIDTTGLKADEQKGLAQKMITVLQHRIDPANIQNLIWRPIGNTRLEIQMPLASSEAQAMRDNFRDIKEKLLAKNVSRARIIEALSKPKEQRTELFNNYAQGDPNRLSMLTKLADLYDKRADLQKQRDDFDSLRGTAAKAVTTAGMDINKVNSNIVKWKVLTPDELDNAVKSFTDVNDNIPILKGYVEAYSKWADVADELAKLNPEYLEAINAIDNLNLTQDQLDVCLDMPEGSSDRVKKLDQLKSEFPDRAGEIDAVVKAYDDYRPYRGRLDDPQDLQRMLKGAGILEFRLLPTQTSENVDTMNAYVQRLQEKGPEYASDNDYQWCKIENIDDWHAEDDKHNPTVVAQFGNNFYVLASNKPSDCILHSTGEGAWKLEKSFPTTDQMGRRAIGLLFNIKGGKLFSDLTSKNVGKPLCILLDNIAISAPNINTRVGRDGIIQGVFSQTQVEDMVNKLNAGSLPARLIEQPISVNTIGPSIGTENRDEGIRAGIIGLIAVVAVMAVYYMVSGAIADVALLLNLLFILAIMAGIRATFHFTWYRRFNSYNRYERRRQRAYLRKNSRGAGKRMLLKGSHSKRLPESVHYYFRFEHYYVHNRGDFVLESF